MGFSTVAATAILGGSCVLMITIFTGGVLPTISDYHEAYKNMEERAVERIQTNINITDVTNTSGIFYDLNITVKNIGRITLKTVDFTILINGTKRAFNCSETYLYAEKDVIFTVNLTGTGLKRMKIISANGIFDYEEYIVE
jgi:archaellum component FlaF (FlaF/FlaG flagellin family)